MLTPNIIEKRGNPRSWDETVTQLVVEMLAHRTPPSCVSANILSVVQLLVPNVMIAKELLQSVYQRVGLLVRVMS
jgi:hypothetical protein